MVQRMTDTNLPPKPGFLKRAWLRYVAWFERSALAKPRNASVGKLEAFADDMRAREEAARAKREAYWASERAKRDK